VQLSYSIGQAQPVRIQVETFGTGHVPNGIIRDLLAQHGEFRLAGIIKQFKLRTLPVQLEGGYQRLAAYGHVGRMDIQLPWEETDMVPILQEHSWCR
jgi:S-adenosylmethionine synthetase